MISAKMVKELRERTGAGILDCQKALKEVEGDMEKAVDWLREKGISKAAKKAGRIAAEGLCSIEIQGNFASICEVNSETDFVAKNDKFINLVANINKAILEAKPNSLEEALKIDYNGKTLNDLIVSSSATIGEKIELRRFKIFEKKDDETFAAYLHMGGKIGVVVVGKGNKETLRDVAMHIAASNPLYLKEEEVSKEEIEREEKVLLESSKNDEKLKNKPENILKNIVKGKLAKWLKEISLLNQPFVKNSDQSVETFLKEEKASIVSFTRFMVGEGIEKKQEDFAKEVYSQVSK